MTWYTDATKARNDLAAAHNDQAKTEAADRMLDSVLAGLTVADGVDKLDYLGQLLEAEGQRRSVTVVTTAGAA